MKKEEIITLRVNDKNILQLIDNGVTRTVTKDQEFIKYYNSLEDKIKGLEAEKQARDILILGYEKTIKNFLSDDNKILKVKLEEISILNDKIDRQEIHRLAQFDLLHNVTEENKNLRKSLDQVEEKCIMYNRSKATPNQCIDFIHNIVLATKGE